MVFVQEQTGNVIYDGKIDEFCISEGCDESWICLITEERKANGLFLKADITFNTTIANMNHYKSGLALSHDDMVRATAEEIKSCIRNVWDRMI